MDTFDIVAGAASLVGLALAGYQFFKDRIKRAREEGNMRLLEERLRNVDTSLQAAATTLQMLIRRADSRDAQVPELQNLARAVRTDLYGAMLAGRGLRENLKNWRFGELLGSYAAVDDQMSPQGAAYEDEEHVSTDE